MIKPIACVVNKTERFFRRKKMHKLAEWDETADQGKGDVRRV